MLQMDPFLKKFEEGIKNELLIEKKNREKFGETFYTRLRLTREQNTKLHGGANSLRKDIPLTLVLILPSNS